MSATQNAMVNIPFDDFDAIRKKAEAYESHEQSRSSFLNWVKDHPSNALGVYEDLTGLVKKYNDTNPDFPYVL